MTDLKPTSNLKHDLPASVVVFLVALPLCLGIALASGVPLFSGIISGVIGGIVIGLLSKSPLSVSGPAAGLTVIVYTAVQTLPSFEAFLLSVLLAGFIQVLLGLVGAGVIGDFIPSSVIKGMLAAIGVILIMKQIPHALGYDKDYEGDMDFSQADGNNTFTELWNLLQVHLSPGAVVISVISLIFLFWWDKTSLRNNKFLGLLPGPLFVVLFAVGANAIYRVYLPDFVINQDHLVSMPISDSFSSFIGNFRFPDFSLIANKQVWMSAVTIGLVASIETLLCLEAVDKLDPYKRISPPNRELFAQGVGNMASGLIGGLPMTSVIVRSSANVSSGAKTNVSTIAHGVILLFSALFISGYLNLIPLSALAAILLFVGYKLTKPSLFWEEYRKGFAHLIPFVVTLVAIVMTDLLKGIGVGLFVAGFFIIYENYKTAILVIKDESGNYILKFTKELSFLHKMELRGALSKLPNGINLMIDLTRTNFVDLDNAEIINDFILNSKHRNIQVEFKYKEGQTILKHINLPDRS